MKRFKLVFDTLLRDTRHGMRRLARDRRFTAAAVLILGCGIGANTAIFSLVNAALFRGQTIADPNRLVDIYQNERQGAPGITSYPTYQDITQYTNIFASSTAIGIPMGVTSATARPSNAVWPNTPRRATCPFLDCGRHSAAGSKPQKTNLDHRS